MGISGPTPMRYAADKPHNPSSFQGHCRWHNKHTHSQPHSGGIGRRRFHWGTAEHGFFRRLYLLRCEYFFDVRMNGGDCDRCLALTMQGARTPVQISNNQIVRAAAPIDPSPCPLPSPCSRNVSCVCFVLYALYVCTFASASRGRVTRSACAARSACSAHVASAVASGTATGVLRVLQSLISQQSFFVMPPKFQPPMYDHRVPREDCAADILCGIRPRESWLIGYSEDEVWDHIMAPIENLQCQALRDHGRRDVVPLVPRYNAFVMLLGMVRPMQVDAVWDRKGLLCNPYMANMLTRRQY